MADTAVNSTNVVSLTKDTAVAVPAGQAVTTGNVAVLTPAAGAPFKGRYMLVRMKESGSVATSVATPKAGVTGGTPSNRAALGDGTAITFSSGQEKVVQLELARYLQADGTVRIAVSGTNASVTFSVLQLSKNAA
jgi:hypothetical protein